MYRVIVGNVGTVEETHLLRDALIAYGEYKQLSLCNHGRASGESVVLMKDDAIVYEHLGRNDDEV